MTIIKMSSRQRVGDESLGMGKLFPLIPREISICMLGTSWRATDKPVGGSNRTLQPARPCHNMLNNVMSLLRVVHNSTCMRLHTTTCNSLITPECWAVRREWKSRLNGWSSRWYLRWFEGCTRVRRSLPVSLMPRYVSDVLQNYYIIIIVK